jgi:hypothetical protein
MIPVDDEARCEVCPAGKQPNDAQSDCVQCPVGQATAMGACTACITGWVPVSNIAGDEQAGCQMYVCSSERLSCQMLASTDWCSATVVFIGAGAVRVQKRMRTKVLA